MNNRFLQAMRTNDMVTENGMPTHSTSGSYLVDLFFYMGGCRQQPEYDLIRKFSASLNEERLLTMKALFYNRDVRGGQGERKSFRTLINWLAKADPNLIYKNIWLIPEYGRWDDLFALMDTPLEDIVLDMLALELENKNRLCAKWMPRENKSHEDWAKKLMKHMHLTPRNYRKLLSSATDVIETSMCKNEWWDIEYAHIPSVASNKYRKAFLRHDYETYSKFIEKAIKGEVKVHADAIYPADIVKKIPWGWSYWGNSNIPDSLSKAEQDAIQAQWISLPDYMPKGKKILPVCDLSGSMEGEPMDVSVSLGIYLSERNIGPFQGMFITFSEHPTFQYIQGANLYEKVRFIRKNNFAENTNLEAVFKMVLSKAVESNLHQDDLPDTILIISDMQFDQCTGRMSDNAYQMIVRMYREAGYNVPNIVFWNVSSKGGVPVKCNTNGTALVSGYSPSIMKSVLCGEMNPLAIVNKTLNSERYSKVVI
jgi:hypothetical protein